MKISLTLSIRHRPSVDFFFVVRYLNDAVLAFNGKFAGDTFEESCQTISPSKLNKLLSFLLTRFQRNVLVSSALVCMMFWLLLEVDP